MKVRELIVWILIALAATSPLSGCKRKCKKCAKGGGGGGGGSKGGGGGGGDHGGGPGGGREAAPAFNDGTNPNGDPEGVVGGLNGDGIPIDPSNPVDPTAVPPTGDPAPVTPPSIGEFAHCPKDAPFVTGNELLSAVRRGEIDKLPELLKKPETLAQVTAAPPPGVPSPLVCAIEGGADGQGSLTATIVEYLLEAGASVNLLDSENNSPLATAVHVGNAAVVQVLLKHPKTAAFIEPNTQNRAGFAPLHIALAKLRENPTADRLLVAELLAGHQRTIGPTAIRDPKHSTDANLPLPGLDLQPLHLVLLGMATKPKGSVEEWRLARATKALLDAQADEGKITKPEDVATLARAKELFGKPPPAALPPPPPKTEEDPGPPLTGAPPAGPPPSPTPTPTLGV